MKISFIKVVFTFASFLILIHLNSESYGQSCEEQSSAYQSFYKHQGSYIPDNTTAIKTIILDFHIWQSENPDSLDNWDPNNNVNHYDRLVEIVHKMNDRCEKLNPPSDPILNPNDEIDDIRIRFEVGEFYDYQNNQRNVSTSGPINFINHVKFYHPNNYNRHHLPIHITNGVSSTIAGLAATHVGFKDLSKELGVTTLKSGTDDPLIIMHYDDGFAKHLLHEVFHNIGLGHTYKTEIGGGDDTRTISDLDFLTDVFGTVSPGLIEFNCSPVPNNNHVCPHDGFWGCVSDTLGNSCTNNILGGTKSGSYLSPLQIGRMHRNMSFQSIR
ncbi:MAG: hypothetical protein HRT72_11295, partial [Flavobacteriales bacterium]|nr:hypothetical protein [Flavobacteriales bacterium]